MQVLVLYFSKGGNTRKLAEAIARGIEEIDGARALLKRTDQVTKDDFTASDGVVAGSPVRGAPTSDRASTAGSGHPAAAASVQPPSSRPATHPGDRQVRPRATVLGPPEEIHADLAGRGHQGCPPVPRATHPQGAPVEEARPPKRRVEGPMARRDVVERQGEVLDVALWDLAVEGKGDVPTLRRRPAETPPLTAAHAGERCLEVGEHPGRGVDGREQSHTPSMTWCGRPRGAVGSLVSEVGGRLRVDPGPAGAESGVGSGRSPIPAGDRAPDAGGTTRIPPGEPPRHTKAAEATMSLHDDMTRNGLVRPVDGRVLGGVCAGLGRRFGLDPWAARLLFILVLMLLPGSQLLVYPILWILMPSEVRYPAYAGQAYGQPSQASYPQAAYPAQAYPTQAYPTPAYPTQQDPTSAPAATTPADGSAPQA